MHLVGGSCTDLAPPKSMRHDARGHCKAAALVWVRRGPSCLNSRSRTGPSAAGQCWQANGCTRTTSGVGDVAKDAAAARLATKAAIPIPSVAKGGSADEKKQEVEAAFFVPTSSAYSLPGRWRRRRRRIRVRPDVPRRSLARFWPGPRAPQREDARCRRHS